MSPFFDDLEAQLAAAARKRSRRARRRFRGALPVLAAVAVTVAVVIGAFALLGRSRPAPAAHPASTPGRLMSQIPLPRLRRELAYITAATRRVQALPVCHTNSLPHTTFVHASPGRALTSILSPLRRPAFPADRLPRQVVQDVGEPIDIGWTRRARVAGGTAYYLVPTRENPAAGQPSVRCFDAQEAAMRRYAPRIPVGLRAQTVRLFTSLVAYDRSLVSGPPRDVLCVVSVQGSGSDIECGITAAQVRTGSGISGLNDTESVLLPDGVATVTLYLPRADGRPAVSVSGRVLGNIFAVRSRLLAGRQPTRVVWRAADGRILRTIEVPSPARYCRRHQVICANVMGASSSGGSSSGVVSAGSSASGSSSGVVSAGSSAGATTSGSP